MFEVAGGIIIAIVVLVVLIVVLFVIGELAARRSEFKQDRRKREQWRRDGYRWPR